MIAPQMERIERLIRSPFLSLAVKPLPSGNVSLRVYQLSVQPGIGRTLVDSWVVS